MLFEGIHRRNYIKEFNAIYKIIKYLLKLKYKISLPGKDYKTLDIKTADNTIK